MRCLHKIKKKQLSAVVS